MKAESHAVCCRLRQAAQGLQTPGASLGSKAVILKVGNDFRSSPGQPGSVSLGVASVDSNTSGRIADALHPVFEAPEVSVSATGRRRFPLHVPRTRIRELQ